LHTPISITGGPIVTSEPTAIREPTVATRAPNATIGGPAVTGEPTISVTREPTADTGEPTAAPVGPTDIGEPTTSATVYRTDVTGEPTDIGEPTAALNSSVFSMASRKLAAQCNFMTPPLPSCKAEAESQMHWRGF